MACFATAKVTLKGVAHTVRRIHIPVGLTSGFSVEASFFERKQTNKKLFITKTLQSCSLTVISLQTKVTVKAKPFSQITYELQIKKVNPRVLPPGVGNWW